MADRTGTYYAASEGIHGYGAELQCKSGGGTWESVAGVTVITPGSMETADIVQTHLRSPDAHHEHRPGMRDSGAFELELIWLPEEQSQSNAGGGSGPFTSGGMVALWRARTTHDWRIVIPTPGSPSGIYWPFRGYVSRFQPTAIGVADEVVKANVGIMPTEAYDADLP